MPFTPYHLGPALLIGSLSRRLSLIVLLGFSVVLDVEPFLFGMAGLDFVHGFFHSYLGSSMVAIFGSSLILVLRRRLENSIAFLKIPLELGRVGVFSSAFLGVYSHVFLDSFLYPEMRPFIPLQENPMYLPALGPAVYSLCLSSFIVALPLIFVWRGRSWIKAKTMEKK